MARTVNPEKHAARRAAILSAAATVFAERGYDGATTAAICAEAGVGSGTLFHYFGDKRSIFLAIVIDDFVAVAGALDELDRTDPVRALDQILDVLMIEFGNPISPGLASAMIQLAQRDPEFAITVVTKGAQVRAALTGLIRDGQSRGLFTTDLDPARAARWIVALTDGGYLMSDDEDFDAALDRAEVRRIVRAYLGCSPTT